MNNLDKIFGRIEEDAGRRIDGIRQETEERIRILQKETEETIAALRTEQVQQTEKEEAAIASRSASAAAMRRREVLLAEKTGLLTEVYRQAEAQILALPKDEYTAFLAGLAAQAVVERVNTVRFLESEYKDEAFAGEIENGYTLLLSAADRDTIGQTVLDAVTVQVKAVLQAPPVLTLSDEDAGITGGVVVRYGDTETTCSVPGILVGLRDELDPMLLKILFA